MRIPLSLRVARACAIATVILSLGLAPSFARMGGSAGGSFAHSSFGTDHASHLAPRGFNQRFETGRFGFNRFGPNRFDRSGFNRLNRFGPNRFGGNQFFGGWGGSGWDGWGGVPASTGASEPILAGDGAPVIINIGVDPGQGDAGGALSGGCVIHKLNYDNAGKYVGERQIPQC
jgi:hypothetical protein